MGRTWGPYFDSQVNIGLEAGPLLLAAGQKLYRAGDAARGIPACMACHGPPDSANEPRSFRRSRQHSVYVVKQLND